MVLFAKKHAIVTTTISSTLLLWFNVIYENKNVSSILFSAPDGGRMGKKKIKIIFLFHVIMSDPRVVNLKSFDRNGPFKLILDNLEPKSPV